MSEESEGEWADFLLTEAGNLTIDPELTEVSAWTKQE